MKTIAVTSGKGGVGKTSLAVNIGVGLAKQGKRVIVFDGDLGLANIDILTGITPQFNLQHVVSDQKQLIEVVTQAPSGIGIISGGSAISSLMHAGPKRLGRFFEQFDQLKDHTDYLIIDTSAGIENRVMAFLAIADEVWVVTNSEPTSITDSYALIKVHTRKHPDANMNIIINSVRRSDEGVSTFLALRQVAEVFLNQDLNFLGEVRHDPIFTFAVKSRTPFVQSHPKSDASVDVQKLAERISLSHVTSGPSHPVLTEEGSFRRVA
jgi:flagellar biosynthesis protein FlhG